MELYMVCVLIAIAMSMFIIKGIQCVMSVTHPLPDKELQWKRSPHLPSQELRAVKSKNTKKSKNSWKKQQQGKQLLAHLEIPMESVFIEEEIDGNFDRGGEERPERMERLERPQERGDSRATMV
ncbi:unnamed protein product [Medioppia subpectinata]|uniref:Uncharacterized protein n=1 Tax=Medioppia subpectinata TaxID=1979941 RepID=A0A7R9KNJ9_9ACAR|nr:unnamed protein product [Medioppia subpectinata]CAG2106874.1 unnamed protein product [Medioppia subpectinata]